MRSITIQVSDDRFLDLRELAESLAVTPEPLNQANVEDTLALPKEEKPKWTQCNATRALVLT